VNGLATEAQPLDQWHALAELQMIAVSQFKSRMGEGYSSHEYH
jgi:hypothetical protein